MTQFSQLYFLIKVGIGNALPHMPVQETDTYSCCCLLLCFSSYSVVISSICTDFIRISFVPHSTLWGAKGKSSMETEAYRSQVTYPADTDWAVTKALLELRPSDCVLPRLSALLHGLLFQKAAGTKFGAAVSAMATRWVCCPERSTVLSVPASSFSPSISPSICLYLPLLFFPLSPFFPFTSPLLLLNLLWDRIFFFISYRVLDPCS